MLELADATLVVTRFDFQVARDLALWGYDVVEARPTTEVQVSTASAGTTAPALAPA